MKISLNWLSDYIQIKDPPEKIAEILSDLGFPTEQVLHIAGDTVIDIEVPSNRGDCLSLLGIARELAAAAGKELKLPTVKLDESQSQVAEFASVEIADPDLCPRYTARVIKDVKIAPSPDWMKKRLEAIGLRSVNNVVDATNYAMIETGQPPHAFDYDKIAQGKIIVRKAVAGEQLVSIDGTKCELDPDMLIIADPQDPVAIAGVMGGLHTEVSQNTTTILLEDAYFEPVSIRRTSRKLSLPSESSYRFERIVDIESVDCASMRTAQLITQVAGGKVAEGVVDIFPKKPAQKQVNLRLPRLSKLLGIDIATEDVVKILSKLSFDPQQKDDSIICSVPTWRSDISREVDLIEEVTRIYGYDKIPTERKIKIEVLPVDDRQSLLESITTYLNACGFYDTISVGFVDRSIAGLFTDTGVKEHLSARDISTKSSNLLRQTLLGSLLAVLKRNLNVGNTPCRIFEIADTFVPSTDKKTSLPIEKTKIALACDSDLRDLRGVIDGLFKNINSDAEIVFTPTDLLWAQTGTQIRINGRTFGTAGLVSEKVRDKFGFKELAPAAAELDFAQLSALQAGPIKVKPIPRFPAIQRDLSIIVDESVTWSDIAKAIGKKAPDELEDIQFVGIYRGEGITSGRKSLTLSLRFRDTDGTLTHETVDQFQSNIVKNLSKSLKAQLRTV
ncbi:MAG: phenylalanine--tRNA ligase subunit beta [Planctomycetota bacterium]|jgi:phenylalanyl-tRNA synthetase beta chain